MKVLSLFDGCAMAYQALKNAGIKVDKYYSSEVDKYAIKIAKKNHADIVELGDVTKWKEWQIEKPDLIVGGSPCQGFSLAGKQLNFNDERSRLFFEFVDIVNYYKPKYFLLENVKMKSVYSDEISRILGVEPVLVNSLLVSAQNRQRLYWCNWQVEQPEDRGILLKDILETDENSNYVFMSDKFINRNSKAGCLVDSTKKKASNLSAMEYVKNGRQGDYLACDETGKPIQINPCKKAGGKQPYIQDRVFDVEGKSHALTASFADRTKVGINCREKSKTVRSGGRGSYDRHEWDSVGDKGTATIRTASGGGHIPSICLKDMLHTQKAIDYMNKGNIVLKIEERDLKYRSNAPVNVNKNKFNTLRAQAGSRTRGIGITEDNVTWRKLTPIECERLQTLPDDYTEGVSNTQRYKMLGNGFTVAVIEHLFKEMLK